MIGLILLCVLGALFLMTLVVLSLFARGLDEYQQRYLSRGARDLGDMFYFVDRRTLLLLTLVVSLSLGALGFAFFNWFIGLMLLALGFVAPFFAVGRLRLWRVRRFEQQLVDGLMQMSAALRGGLSLAQAIESIAQESNRPLSDEFGLLVKEIKLGVSLEESLNNLAARVESEDLQLVVTSTNIAKQAGGNMAEMYETISATIQERFRMEGKIRAITAQGKLQGWVVGAMPLALGLILNYMRPDLMQPMLHSSFGYGLVAAIVVMEILAVLMIRRIVSIDV